MLPESHPHQNLSSRRPRLRIKKPIVGVFTMKQQSVSQVQTFLADVTVDASEAILVIKLETHSRRQHCACLVARVVVGFGVAPHPKRR